MRRINALRNFTAKPAGRAVLVLALALIVPAVLLAQPGHGRHGDGHHGRGFHRHHHPGGPGMMFAPGAPFFDHLAEELDLTEAQQESIAEIVDGHRDEFKGKLEAIHTGHQALFDQIHAEAFDESAIRAASQQVAATEADLAVLRARVLDEIRQVLTPEQRIEAKELLANHRERMERFRERSRDRFAPEDEE